MAEIAVNPQTGEAVYLNDSGAWVPAPKAKNPQTGQELIYNGRDWQAKPGQSRSLGENVAGYAEQAISGVPIVGPLAQKFSAAAQAVMGQGQGETIGDRYSSNVKQADARRDQFAKDNPGTSALAQGTGGAGAMVATLPAAATSVGAHALGLVGKNVAQRMASGAASGAGIGGADSYLRTGDASPGVQTGLVVGAAAPALAQGVGAMARGVRNAFSPEANVSADLTRAIARDGMSPGDLAQRAQLLAADRPGVATLADAGGENVRGLVERVAQTPGAGRTQVVPALTERQKFQADRLGADLSMATGTRQSATQALDQTMQARQAAATPLYQRAYQDGDKFIWSPELERLSSSPAVKSAMQGAVSTWRDVAIADGFGAMNPGALGQAGQIKFMPGGGVPVMPNLQFWDYTKRILDDHVAAAVRAGEGQKVKTLSSLTQMLRNEIDNVVPSYAAARNAWAGPSRYMDAIEKGREILSPKMGAEEMRNAFGALTAAEQEAFRIGAVSAIRGKMGSDSAKLGDMTKYIRSPEVRAKIDAIMPDKQTSDAFFRKLDFEVSSSELTGRSLGNSATARRLAERQDADNLPADLAMSALGVSPIGSIWRQFLTAVPSRIRDTMRSKADARLADVLTVPANATGNALAAIMAPVGRAAGRTNNALTLMMRGTQPALTDQ